jgi:hypothetical protein
VDVDAVPLVGVGCPKAGVGSDRLHSGNLLGGTDRPVRIIGQMTLAVILVGRAKMDADLQKIIDERTTPWGITVQSVEIRHVVIPPVLEDAMSRQAQAERERQACVILGESE